MDAIGGGLNGDVISNGVVDHVDHHVAAYHWHSIQTIVDHGKDLDCIIVQLHELGVQANAEIDEGVMNAGIGDGKTREDHKSVSDQLYAAYAQGRELRGLVAIVGEDALNERDLQLLKFADIFENPFLRQRRDEDRSISEGTLDYAWELLSNIDTKYLVRLDQKWIDKYHPTDKKE